MHLFLLSKMSTALGSNSLFMVEILAGLSTNKTNNPDGFDSCKGPFHNGFDCCEGLSHNGETILVHFTTEQALPCFVMHYSVI